MKIAGIIAEYDPFHSGHAHQLARLRAMGAEKIVICMSAGAVQRGGLAILPADVRVRAALTCGADLVVALPAPYACSSAESFAAAGVHLLTAMGCDTLAFGAETPDTDRLQALADVVDSPALEAPLKAHLAEGLPFAAARAAAVAELAPELAPLLESPNNLLGVEYCKAIRRQQSPMVPMALERYGAGHGAEIADSALTASGSAIRNLWYADRLKETAAFIPDSVMPIYEDAVRYGRRLSPLRLDVAVLSRLRAMSREQLAGTRGVNEGLEHRLAAALQTAASLEELYDGMKTKRYAHARLRRLVLDAALGYDADLPTLPPFALVLGAAREALPLCKNAVLPCGTSLADLAAESPACAAVARAHAAAVDLSALCREKPGPMGLAYTAKPVIL